MSNPFRHQYPNLLVRLYPLSYRTVYELFHRKIMEKEIKKENSLKGIVFHIPEFVSVIFVDK